MGGQDELPHVMARVALIARMWAGYEQHIADVAGLSVDEVRAHEALQWWLLPDEALAAHLIHGVALSQRYPVQ
jgi:hypothetical protein